MRIVMRQADRGRPFAYRMRPSLACSQPVKIVDPGGGRGVARVPWPVDEAADIVVSAARQVSQVNVNDGPI